MLREKFAEIGPELADMTIEIEDGESGVTLLRFILPDHARGKEAACREVLETEVFELDALFRYGLVRFEFDFVPLANLEGRKLSRLRDRRKFAARATGP